MVELILLFYKQILDDISSRSMLKEEPMLKAEITTPLGKLEGIRPSQLERLRIPYISETGRVGRIKMERLYVEQALDNLATELQLERHSLLDGNREVVIVAETDTSSDSECIPCYYGTTRNPVNMENLQHLEANVMRCLNEELEYLPPHILSNWINIVLNPIFEQARTVMSGEDTRQAD